LHWRRLHSLDDEARYRTDVETPRHGAQDGNGKDNGPDEELYQLEGEVQRWRQSMPAELDNLHESKDEEEESDAKGNGICAA
jgi:hypothetical protein